MLKVQALPKVYWDGPTSKVAIDDISFAVRPQEFLSIGDPSGAGKTRCWSA